MFLLFRNLEYSIEKYLIFIFKNIRFKNKKKDSIDIITDRSFYYAET